MQLKIPIKQRNRDFGLFSWRLPDDFDVKTLFSNEKLINLSLNGKVKTKKVDYRHRRFSIGKTVMKEQKESEFFVLEKDGDTIFLTFE